jgi:hypothetical protein
MSQHCNGNNFVNMRAMLHVNALSSKAGSTREARYETLIGKKEASYGQTCCSNSSGYVVGITAFF